MILGLHPLDVAVLAGYFLLVAYLGIGLGKKKTKTLARISHRKIEKGCLFLA